jgi:hypothetical protein
MSIEKIFSNKIYYCNENRIPPAKLIASPSQCSNLRQEKDTYATLQYITAEYFNCDNKDNLRREYFLIKVGMMKVYRLHVPHKSKKKKKKKKSLTADKFRSANITSLRADQEENSIGKGHK